MFYTVKGHLDYTTLGCALISAFQPSTSQPPALLRDRINHHPVICHTHMRYACFNLGRKHSVWASCIGIGGSCLWKGARQISNAWCWICLTSSRHVTPYLGT